ncbi:hypothetical protein BS47DRAFT_1362627 [Hydnum rufescens UP504]|uniref:DUF3533 domain-containing protein n=1 Tax=Hydnum rufescens UP504 TaxID=1448309 RepID=A0A9P6AXI2_9AGAM|nr:hypothetical protein BS47DRAFT_1362627 [Hydnum rufescens UP504]
MTAVGEGGGWCNVRKWKGQGIAMGVWRVRSKLKRVIVERREEKKGGFMGWQCGGESDMYRECSRGSEGQYRGLRGGWGGKQACRMLPGRESLCDLLWRDPTCKPASVIAFSLVWDPDLSRLRRLYVRVMAQTLIPTVILVGFAYMDGCDIGNAMRTAIQANISTKAKLGWIIKDASNFPTITDVSSQIVDERAWAALVVSRNATSNLISAHENGDASYDPSTAMVFLYNQGRNEVAANSFIVPFSQALISSAAANFAASYASYDLQHSVSSGNHSYDSLSAPVASALTLVGSIYTISFAFVITLSGYALRQAIEPFLKTKDLLLLRVLAPPIFSAPIWLAYSMTSLCIKTRLMRDRAGGFFIFWLYDLMGMTALGLSIEAIITFLTPKYMTYFLVPLIWLWIPSIQHAASNAHTHIQHEIPSGSQSRMLVAWIALSCFMIPLFAFVMRRRAMAACAREAPSSVNGIHADQGKVEGSKNDTDAEVMSVDEKSPAHDYDPPALKSQSDETFDIERQQ